MQTVRGVAKYPHLNEPDTKYKDDGEFHTKLIIDADTAEALRTQLAGMIDEKTSEVQQELKGKKPVVLDPPIAPELDDEENETGNFIIRVKMKASGVSKKTKKPYTRFVPIFDAKGKPSKARIGGGSVLNVSFEPAAYKGQSTETKDVKGKKTKVTITEVGATLYLEAVQVIELVSGGSAANPSKFGFGEEEGYTAGDEPETTEEAGEASGGSGKGGYDF